jgi:dolichyl-phosphate-mannose--protein O-mannosyl transferase
MRNSPQLFTTPPATLPDREDTAWSLSGGLIGFAAWMLALGFPFFVYGANTLFFFLYTWPFFLALLPVALVTGVALHSLLAGRLGYSVVFTLLTVGAMFGALFMWLLG